MDLNPQSDHSQYELADYCLSQNTDTLLLCNAWLDSGENGEDDTDLCTVKYWTARLSPLWEYDDGHGHNADTNRDIIVIICNRTGTEEGDPAWKELLRLLNSACYRFNVCWVVYSLQDDTGSRASSYHGHVNKGRRVVASLEYPSIIINPSITMLC